MEVGNLHSHESMNDHYYCGWDFFGMHVLHGSFSWAQVQHKTLPQTCHTCSSGKWTCTGEQWSSLLPTPTCPNCRLEIWDTNKCREKPTWTSENKKNNRAGTQAKLSTEIELSTTCDYSGETDMLSKLSTKTHHGNYHHMYVSSYACAHTKKKKKKALPIGTRDPLINVCLFVFIDKCI